MIPLWAAKIPPIADQFAEWRQSTNNKWVEATLQLNIIYRFLNMAPALTYDHGFIYQGHQLTRRDVSLKPNKTQRCAWTAGGEVNKYRID